MLKDSVIFEYENGTLTVNQYSFCEIMKHIMVNYVNISYDEASKIVDNSGFVEPIKDVMEAALLSHELEYYWAIGLYYKDELFEKGICEEPENFDEYFAFLDDIMKKYNLKEPFEWD